MTAELHLAENTFALHLLLERLESLIDVIVANENLHAASFVLIEQFDRFWKDGDGRADKWPGP
jgi:hypothetical protein